MKVLMRRRSLLLATLVLAVSSPALAAVPLAELKPGEWIRGGNNKAPAHAWPVEIRLQVLAAGASAVPPPVEQLTANCVAPVFASDQLVCADPELRALDDQLRRILAARAGIQGLELEESDYQWFLRRSRCAFQEEHRACLLQAYRERLALLLRGSQSIGRTFRSAAPL